MPDLSHEKELWWAVVLTVIGALGAIGAFWDKLGKSVVINLLWPVIKYFIGFVRMPYDIGKLAQEVANKDGSSLKDLVCKNAVETLEISNQVKLINRRSRAAMAISPHANFEADRNGKWVWANKAMYRLFGATGDEIRDWGWMAFVYDEDRERVEERWNVGIIRGEDVDMAFSIMRASTEKVKIHAYVHVMKDENDKVLGYFGMFMREP